jgi:small-conductance mechanosensitive channel
VVVEWARAHLPLLTALGVVAGAVLLGLLARGVLLRRLAAVAARTPWRGDDALVDSLRRPLPFWFALAGLYAVARWVELPGALERAEGAIFSAVLIVSLTLWLSDLAGRLTASIAGVVQIVARLAVVALGGLVLLSTLGISVTPILTTVGIGGLAVALGLQDTLANVFAGIHLSLAGNLRVGDFVKLESGEEGVIEDIAWRSTRVRTLPNNTVVIPNGKLAQSVVTNYDLPSRDLAVLVPVGVHYASDLEHVEATTCDVARQIMKTTPGGVPEFDPFIRFHTFGSSSIDFTVILRARALGDTFVVKHEFVKALARRYAAEGIVIPFPIRALNLDQEGARKPAG